MLTQFLSFEIEKLSLIFFAWEKRVYDRETIPFIRISPLAESPTILSWLDEILELRKGLIIWDALKDIYSILYFSIIKYLMFRSLV